MEDSVDVKKKRGRPPKVDNTRIETRERLVRAGTAILTIKGLASTGLDEILKQTKIPKGSFYHYFSSKDDFGLAVIENYGRYFASKLDHWLLNEDRPPLGRIQDFIEDAKSGMARHQFKRGCLIGNLGQELGSLDEKFRAPLEETFLDWQNRVAQCLEAAKATGDLKPDVDCKDTAAFFWIGWEGAILRSKLVQSNQPIDLFTSVFFKGL